MGRDNLSKISKATLQWCQAQTGIGGRLKEEIKHSCIAEWIITNLLDILNTTGKFLLMLVSITTMDSKELAGQPEADLCQGFTSQTKH